MEMHYKRSKPLMLIGGTGTGKTATLKSNLNALKFE